MHLRSLVSQALALSFVLLRASAVDVQPDGIVGTTEAKLEDAIVKATGSFVDNPFSNVFNGQQNTLEILFENKSPKDVVLKEISGMFSNAKTGVILRNTTAQKLGISISAGNGVKLPYSFHSEFKPQEARFKVLVDYEKDTVPEQVVAFDGLVAIVEPPVSLLDWRLLSTYGFVLALLAGAGYYTYLSFFPAPKKGKSKVKVVPVGPVDTPVTPGSGVYNEEWIPAHHMTRQRSKKDALSSGDESDRRRKR